MGIIRCCITACNYKATDITWLSHVCVCSYHGGLVHSWNYWIHNIIFSPVIFLVSSDDVQWNAAKSHKTARVKKEFKLFLPECISSHVLEGKPHCGKPTAAPQERIWGVCGGSLCLSVHHRVHFDWAHGDAAWNCRRRFVTTPLNWCFTGT